MDFFKPLTTPINGRLIDSRNTNTIWASVLVETLVRLGLTTAILCPGSRSAPLAIAFATHPNIDAIPVLDERSAAFFALGIARRTQQPVVLVCTSGTASANFYPAIIEAHISRIPLLVLTADRPPELRDCNSGQTIDQQKIYGNFPNWYAELAVPELQLSLLAYLRQIIIQAWERSRYPVAGVVHLNVPLRDPLAPVVQPAAQTFCQQWDAAEFFTWINTEEPSEMEECLPLPPQLTKVQLALPTWCQGQGIIIAGVAQLASSSAYCQAIAHLSKTLGFPVLAEGLSPVRHHTHLNPFVISTYDLILRNTELADSLAPAVVIRVGEMPTSKELRAWLVRTQPRQWVVDEGDRNLDPLHGKTTHLRCSIEQLATWLQSNRPAITPGNATYLQQWLAAEMQARRVINTTLAQTDGLIESKVAWLLSQTLPPQTPIFVANSTAVRDVEWFWQASDRATSLFCNRGANGIDGTVSTALGMAHHHRSSVLLTGDLALLHDTNGFLLSPQFVGHLTIVLINNNGGGIFEMLPIAQFDPPFEDYFATPQSINVARLCQTYRVNYHRIGSWSELQLHLNPLPTTGMQLLEIQTDRKQSAQWRQHFFQTAWDQGRGASSVGGSPA